MLEEVKFYDIPEMWRKSVTYLAFVWYFDYALIACNSTQSF